MNNLSENTEFGNSGANLSNYGKSYLIVPRDLMKSICAGSASERRKIR
jgi:hypothetical protein